MATDSIMGLFASPEQLQQAQYNQALDRSIQLAKLSPVQRGLANVGASSYMLGGAIGSALGAEDPMLKRQAARRAMVQQVNPADANSLKQAIQASSGDPELQQYFFNKYKELTGIQKEQSVIAKNEAWEAAKTDSEKKRNLLSDVEQSLTEGKQVDPTKLNQARLAWAQETKPKTFQDPTTGTIQTVPGVDVNLFPSLGKLIGGAGGGGGTGKAGVITTPASEKIAAQAEQAQEDVLSNLKNGLTNIDKARTLTKSWTTNPWISATTENLPTDAMALKDTVTALNSQKTIDLISRMKQQSKTGATGFGSVTEKELDLLQSDIVKLNYRSPTFKSDLKRVEDKWKEIINKIEIEKAQKGGAVTQKPAQTPTTNTNTEQQISAFIAYNKSKFGKEPTRDEAIKALRAARRID